MGYILDILIVALFSVCVIYGGKKGFFKSLMTLVTGVASFIAAYALTPSVSLYIKETFVKESVSKTITNTFASIAQGSAAAAGETLYDAQKLLQDPQVMKMLESFGKTQDSLEKIAFEAKDGYSAVQTFADMVADPIATMISDVIAFGVLFAAALVVLKLVTVIVGVFFKLPVLSTLDKTMGVVFGIASGLFFAIVVAIAVSSLSQTLASASPGTFSNEIVENSLIIKLFSDTNILGNISEAAK